MKRTTRRDGASPLLILRGYRGLLQKGHAVSDFLLPTPSPPYLAVSLACFAPTPRASSAYTGRFDHQASLQLLARLIESTVGVERASIIYEIMLRFFTFLSRYAPETPSYSPLMKWIFFKANACLYVNSDVADVYLLLHLYLPSGMNYISGEGNTEGGGFFPASAYNSIER